MPSDPVVVTLAGTAGSALATVAVWVLTSRRKDGAEGVGFVADAAQAITESAMAIVAQQQQEVHDCQEALAEVRAELAELRALIAGPSTP